MRRHWQLPSVFEAEADLYATLIGRSVYQTDNFEVVIQDDTIDNMEPQFTLIVRHRLSRERAYLSASFGNMCDAAEAFVKECEKYYRKDHKEERDEHV